MITQNAKNPKWKDYNGNYFIYSKEASKFYVLNNKHQIIDSIVAGRGGDRGDYQNTADLSDKTGDPQVGKKTTAAGRYAIKYVDDSPEQWKDYDTPFYTFISDKYGEVGVHGVWKGNFDYRMSILNNPAIKDKLFSYGCINVPKEFLYKYPLAKGDSLFITKEPKGI